jgi:hypothetical protein
MPAVSAERAAAMNVEILFFDGCPSFETLVPRLRGLVAEYGVDPDDITLRPVETLEAAEAARFLGSPSVRVNGRDVDPSAAQHNDFGLKCRIYRSEAGQAPIPPEDWIRAALAAPSEATTP